MDNPRLMLIILAPVSTVSIIVVDSSFGVILGKIVLLLFTDSSVKIGLNYFTVRTYSRFC